MTRDIRLLLSLDFLPPSFFKTEAVVVRSVVGRLDGLIDGMVTLSTC
jgi:hypothetical protein